LTAGFVPTRDDAQTTTDASVESGATAAFGDAYAAKPLRLHAPSRVAKVAMACARLLPAPAARCWTSRDRDSCVVFLPLSRLKRSPIAAGPLRFDEQSVDEVPE
jgi:hypothetical protein